MHQIFKWMNRSSLQLTHHSSLNLVHDDAFDININLQKQILSTVSSRFYSIYINMDATDYWPMAREYSIWNATIASLQFWTADLDMHTLGNTIEEVYSVFFYTASTHTLCQQSDKILFSHFMTTLNAAFEQKLALEDEGYDSGSGNFNIPTLLRKTLKIHHRSSIEKFFI